MCLFNFFLSKTIKACYLYPNLSSREKLMEKRICILLLVLALSVLSNGEKGNDRGEESMSEIDRKLRILHKPATKTIMSEDGDTIDCVDIYKQPAFDHPSLKNHTLQIKPSFELTEDTLSTKHNNSRAVTSQIWRKSGICPNGTVPIRRIQREDFLRAASLDRFGRKHPSNSDRERRIANRDHLGSFNLTGSIYSPTPENRSDSILLTYGYNYVGASAYINVWNPHVEKPGEYSTAQIWLKNMAASGFESVEAGWQVNPGLYGDLLTRLFVHWTDDAYQSTGCFDLTCSGFVQTNKDVALGAALSPGSSTRQVQYFLGVRIRLDPNTGNWWVLIGDYGEVGYWPGSLFSYGLKQSAIIVQWGGEVYSLDVKKTPHTKTAMGSGQEAEELYGTACYIANARITDYSLVPKYPTWVSVWMDEPYCYSGTNYREEEPAFFFGGPGQNWGCP